MTMRVAAAPMALAAMVLAAAGACQEAPPRAGARFRIDHPDLTEASGLAASRQNAGYVWTHNDSGHGAYLLAIGPDRRLRFRLKVQGAKALDWEDLCLGRGADGRDWLYIADTGRNLAHKRAEPTRIWAIPEPRIGSDIVLGAGEHGAGKLPVFRSEPARRWTLVYAVDPVPDVEAAFLYPGGGAIGLVEKTDSGKARIFAAALPAQGQAARDADLPVVEVARVRIRGDKGRDRKITGGAVTAGGKLALLTYTALAVLPLPPLPAAARDDRDKIPRLKPEAVLVFPRLTGAEALAITAGGQALIASEGRPAEFVIVPLPRAFVPEPLPTGPGGGR